MQNSQKTKIALITGGSSGIGLAIAHRLARENYKVAVADITDFPEKSEKIFFKKTDVSDAEAIDQLYNWTVTTIGKPDILVLNAGQGIQEKLAEGDPEKWQKVINTNIMGALRCIRGFVPHMLEQEEGNVVIISSVAANNPHPYGGIYSASKTALEVIAETLRLETLPHINVTVVSPGVTDTNFFNNQISGNSSVEAIGMGSISASEIADDVFYAITRKKGTSINKIVTRPLAQSF